MPERRAVKRPNQAPRHRLEQERGQEASVLYPFIMRARIHRPGYSIPSPFPPTTEPRGDEHAFEAEAVVLTGKALVMLPSCIAESKTHTTRNRWPTVVRPVSTMHTLTVAVRGELYMSASSPKASPDLSVRTASSLLLPLINT